MKTIPYLNFDGTCAEAFRFYAEVLRGELSLMTHGEAPIADEVPPSWHSRIMHAYLKADGVELMASDTPPDYDRRPSGFSVSLHLDSAEEADRIYTALVTGGRATMPIGRTFWAERFAMLVDRFGTPWMVNYEGDAATLAASAIPAEEAR